MRVGASYAMRQARLFPSDASSERIDPFVLSTPRSRGLEATPSPGEPAKPSGPAQKWALVIGIASFEDKVIPPLSYTASDAKSFADVPNDLVVVYIAAHGSPREVDTAGLRPKRMPNRTPC